MRCQIYSTGQTAGSKDRIGLIDWDKIGQVKECEMLAKPDNWFS